MIGTVLAWTYPIPGICVYGNSYQHCRRRTYTVMHNWKYAMQVNYNSFICSVWFFPLKLVSSFGCENYPSCPRVYAVVCQLKVFGIYMYDLWDATYLVDTPCMPLELPHLHCICLCVLVVVFISPSSNVIFHIWFFIVVFSIVLQLGQLSYCVCISSACSFGVTVPTSNSESKETWSIRIVRARQRRKMS